MCIMHLAPILAFRDPSAVQGPTDAWLIANNIHLWEDKYISSNDVL